MGRAKLALGVVLLALPLWAGASSARGFTTPKTSLVTNSGKGAGYVYEFDWSDKRSAAGGVCFGGGLRATREFAAPVSFVPGGAMTIELGIRQRPKDMRLAIYPAIDPLSAEPLGSPDSPDVELHVSPDGKSWRATFDPPPWPDLYIDSAVEWPSAGFCGPHRLKATFHARVV